MKVKELKKILEKFDDDLDVVTRTFDTEWNAIEYEDLESKCFSVQEGWCCVHDATVIKTQADVDRLKKFKVLVLDVGGGGNDEKYENSSLNHNSIHCGPIFGEPEDLAFNVWKATGKAVPGWEENVENWEKGYGLITYHPETRSKTISSSNMVIRRSDGS